jgi:N-[(2S)-2-amino-2-carboxyethyl]-L-glutamate dehydrogenase
MGNDLVILNGQEIGSLLANRELEIVQTVQAAYLAHRNGDSSLPHSLFLRFPGKPNDRIIALPTYLGGAFEVAGIKWVASFPENLDKGLDRASAVIILNSTETGIPKAILEGSIISAKRTAASAALAARALRDDRPAEAAGIIGCGLINYEIVRFLLALFPELSSLVVFDKEPDRARQFQSKCKHLLDRVDVSISEDLDNLFTRASLISFATTAAKPHIMDISACRPGTTILHISLRDLSPEVILASDNIVDDVDHVCRAETSVHLAEQIVGNRDFIKGTLADVLTGVIPDKRQPGRATIFSPFGLGVLDLALASLVYDAALKHATGTTIASFLPASWVDRQE